MTFRWPWQRAAEATQDDLMGRMFNLDLLSLLQLLSGKIPKEEPAARTMVLAAFANMRSQLNANTYINRTQGADLPATYSQLGRVTAALFDKYPPTFQGAMEVPSKRK